MVGDRGERDGGMRNWGGGEGRTTGVWRQLARERKRQREMERDREKERWKTRKRQCDKAV